MSSVTSIMKKAICVILTAALVVGFAFVLVACNKTSTETFEMSEDNMAELRNIVSECRTSQSFRTVISSETTTSDGTVKVNGTVTVYSKSAIEYEKVTTAADGSITKEYVAAQDISNMTYARAFYEGDSATPSESTYETKSSVTMSSVTSASGCSEAVTKVTNIIRAGSSYVITQQTGTRYLDDGNLLYTVYTIGYDNEAGDAGTAYVTVTDGAVSKIEIVSSSSRQTVEYTYGYDDYKLPTKTEWFEKHPAA